MLAAYAPEGATKALMIDDDFPTRGKFVVDITIALFTVIRLGASSSQSTSSVVRTVTIDGSASDGFVRHVDDHKSTRGGCPYSRERYSRFQAGYLHSLIKRTGCCSPMPA